MIIVGVNSAYHESSVAVIVDGQIVAAVEEERFNRIKHGKQAGVDNSDQLPWQALKYCLNTAGVRAEEVNHIGYSFDPWLRHNYHWSDEDISSAMAGDFGTPEGEKSFLDSNLRAQNQLSSFMPRARFHFLPHHLCHAASTFLVSPFKEAGILVVDGIAESASTWGGSGVNNNLERLFEVEYPHSLGFLWEKISEFLGFDRYDGPGKLMALGTSTAPRGVKSNIDYFELFRSFVRPKADGTFLIDPSILQYRSSDFQGLETIFGSRSNLAQDAGEKAALAAGLQLVTEDILVYLAEHLYRRVNAKRHNLVSDLCLAGGVALNCVANTEILKRTSWKRLWVQPAANDGGTALGAALVIWSLEPVRSERVSFPNAYLGPEFTKSDCETALRCSGLPFTNPRQISRRVAELIDVGRVVAWFQGRMEFGPRGLGNRSILADPRRLEMRRVINEKIKEREGFRPFAPSVSESCAADFFRIGVDPTVREKAPPHFMLMALPVQAGKADIIPAVVHKNRHTQHESSRIHLVKEGDNPAYEEMLDSFGALSGQPIVLNTSFNISEPIVCSPGQACATFLKSNLDAMVLGEFLVERT